MQKFKTFLTVIGAVTILVLAANSAVYAATGGKFILGHTNKANKVSTLKRTTVGPALSLITKSSATAPFATNGRGKVANLNADKLDGLDSTNFVRGYAHILPGGSFDAARSWNITAANVVHSGGFYCFRGMSFTPRNGSVTPDYNGLLNGQIDATELKLPADPSDCGIASAQAEVFTGLVNPGVFTSGADYGFYVVFH